MPIRRNRFLPVALAALVAGTCFQFGGCFSSAISYAGNYNPCGTVLNCDPETYRIIQSGYTGPGADPAVDPFCTYWPFCEATVDPLTP